MYRIDNDLYFGKPIRSLTLIRVANPVQTPVTPQVRGQASSMEWGGFTGPEVRVKGRNGVVVVLAVRCPGAGRPSRTHGEELPGCTRTVMSSALPLRSVRRHRDWPRPRRSIIRVMSLGVMIPARCPPL